MGLYQVFYMGFGSFGHALHCNTGLTCISLNREQIFSQIYFGCSFCGRLYLQQWPTFISFNNFRYCKTIFSLRYMLNIFRHAYSTYVGLCFIFSLFFSYTTERNKVTNTRCVEKTAVVLSVSRRKTGARSGSDAALGSWLSSICA